MRAGDREAGTVVVKGNGGAAVTLAGRATEPPLFRRAGRKAPEAVRRAMAGLPASVSAPVLTAAPDSGRESAGHAAVPEAPGAGFLLPRPCHPRERGIDEHTDGLPPGCFPKGTDFRKVTDEQVREVQDILNARPRKAPGCLTPEEAFRKARPPQAAPRRRRRDRTGIFRRVLPRSGRATPSLRAEGRAGALRRPEVRITLVSEGTAAVTWPVRGGIRGLGVRGPPPPGLPPRPGGAEDRALHFGVEVGVGKNGFRIAY